MSDAPIEKRPWLTGDEAADYLQVTRRTLERYRQDGILQAFRFGPRTIRYRVEDLDALGQPERAAD